MNKIMQQAAPEFTTDADGLRLAHVALANTDKRVTLYAEDYDRLITDGWSRHWALTNTGGRFEFVLVNGRGPHDRTRTVTVARLIARCGKGQRTHYADGDRTNLRRDNLTVSKGGGNASFPAAALQPRGSFEVDATADKVKRTRKKATQTPTTPNVPKVSPALTRVNPHPPYVPRRIDIQATAQRVRETLAQQALTQGANDHL